MKLTQYVHTTRVDDRIHTKASAKKLLYDIPYKLNSYLPYLYTSGWGGSGKIHKSI
jgi:hypothetical protein